MADDKGKLGEGGPPVVDRGGDEPSGGSRPQRAAHLAPPQRETGIVDRAAPERAIVRQEQRRRARRRELSRRRFFGAAFWGSMGIGLTGGLAAFLSFFWPRGLQGFGGEVPVAADLVPLPGKPRSASPTASSGWFTWRPARAPTPASASPASADWSPSGGSALTSAARCPGAPPSILRAPPAGSAVPATAPPIPPPGCASSAPPRAQWTPWRSP